MQPKRLLDAHGGPCDVKRILRAAQLETAPEELRRTTWKMLAAQTTLTGIALGSTITAAAKGGTAVATGASGAGSSLGAGTLLSKAAMFATVKSLVLGVGIGGGIAAGYSVATHFTGSMTEQRTAAHARSVSTANRKTRQPFDAQETSAVRIPALAAPQELPSNSAIAKPSSALNSPRGPSPQQAGPADSIREEAHRVSETRSLVRSGKEVQALRKLAELDVAFPGGVLRQERDALRIDALFLAGQKREAQKLVRQFSLHYPESPLVARWTSRAE